MLNHYSARSASHFNHVLPLLEALVRRGIEIRLLIEKADDPLFLGTGIEVRHPRTPLHPALRWMWLVREVRRARAKGFSTAFVRIASFSALATILALGRRGRVYFWLSGTTLEFDKSQPRSINKLKWWARTYFPTRLVWRYCHTFVTGPEHMAAYYASHGVRREKIRVLYNDVVVRRFQGTTPNARESARAALREQLQIPEHSIVLLFVHRLSPVRRTLDYLPYALHHLRRLDLLDDTHLLIVGGGPDLPKLMDQARDGGLRRHVHSIGEQPNTEVEKLYAAADVFIQPSHAEGFPRVMLEAMASGLPVVTTDAGGSGDILGRLQQRYVVSKDDPHAFADRLAMLLTERDRWQELRAENSRRVQDFDTLKVARMYEEVLFDG
nr:glycosyltransferase family 4 protein [Phycicoccus sp. Soil748]